MVDFNTDITNKDIDWKAYRTKFAMCDVLMAQEKPDSKEYAKAILDPTCYAYMFFKNDANQPLRMYPYQDMILNDKHRFKYFRSANQIGKFQGYNDIIFTPYGEVRLGDLEVGDLVIGQDGKSHNVLQIFEQGIQQLYKLTFDDGSCCRCGLEHLWKFIHPKNRFKHRDGRKSNSEHNRWSIDTLNEIIKIDGLEPKPIHRIAIPICEPIEFSLSMLGLPLHPYILGVLLGDGSITTKQVTITGDELDDEIIQICNKFLPRGYFFQREKSRRKYCYLRGPLIPFSRILKQLNLLGTYSDTKFIPEIYKYASVYERIELLRGLMDTDGSIYGKCTCEYSTTSKKLAEDVKFLINSLGGKATIKSRKGKYKKEGIYYEAKNNYRIFIKLENINPFLLKRKSDKHYKIRYRKERILRKIEFVGYENCRCILVDSPDNTYLTNDCIVTHNSKTFNVKAAHNLILDHGYSHNEAIISKSLPQSIDQMRRVKMLLNTSQFRDWKDDKGMTESMSVITIDIKDDDGKYLYTNKLICAPCTEGLLGYDLHELNLDEFEFWEIDLKYFFNQIAQPRTYTTKGRIMVMTNPNGMDSFGQELESQRLKATGDRKWHVYVFNYLDKPGNTLDEYEQLKHELPRTEFESTVAAIRSTSDRAYFSPDEIERSYDSKLTELGMVGKQPFFFLDVGSKRDQCVLVGGYVEKHKDYDINKFMELFVPIMHVYPVGYPISRVAGVNIDDSDGWHYEKSVKDYLVEWSSNGINPTFGFDATGNPGMKALFEAIGINAEDVVFSGPAKSGFYQRYKYYMEKGLMHRIRCKEFEYQATRLEMRKSERGYLKIHHANEDDLDDTQDAVAGLIYLTDRFDVVEPSMTLIDWRIQRKAL